MRLSVTDLESYRFWKDSEDSTVEELVRRLTRAEPPTPQMEAGRAFAKLFEHAADRSLHTEEADGWEFYFDLDEEIALPEVRELKGEMVITTPVGPVTLVGQVDGFDGKVYDQKLSERIDAERYLDSLQWRAYLVMFGAREFVYDLFRGRYAPPPQRCVTVDDHHRLSFYTYPAIRTDVERAVCELAEVAASILPTERRT